MPLFALVIVLLAFVDGIALPKAEVLNVKLALVMPRSKRPPPNGEMDVLPTFGSWMSGGASGDDDAGEDDDEEDAEEEVEDRPKVPTPLTLDHFWSGSRLLAPDDDDDDVSVRPKSTKSWTDVGVFSTSVGIDAEKARDIIICICRYCFCLAGHSSFEYNWRSEDLPVPPHKLLSSSWAEKR